MEVFLNILNVLTAFLALVSTILISWIIYKKTGSETAIIKATKAEKREKLNLDYAEKIIIETDELQSNINDLLKNSRATAQKILDKTKKGAIKKEQINQIIIDMHEDSKPFYQSINKFYKLIKIDKNISGVNKKINSEVENIKEIVDKIENTFDEIDILNIDKKTIEDDMIYLMERYDSGNELEQELEDAVGKIISACKDRML